MRTILTDILILLAVLTGFGGGYLLWDRQASWYAADVAKLEPGPENDLIRYGQELIVNTPRYIGKNAEDPAMAFAGNDLACQSCHLKAGLQPFAAPFVSTIASFPMLVDNRVIPLTTRINACMELGMNGRALPEESREMAGLIAYMKFVGKDRPEGVRAPGMGLLPIAFPQDPPDARRGDSVYVKHCTSCHGANGQGEPKVPPEVGYLVPPLWGDGSFNAAAGMAQTAYAASYIRANMPTGTDYEAPVLTVQEAWDVAAYMISHPHPLAPPEPAPEPTAEDAAADEGADAETPSARP